MNTIAIANTVTPVDSAATPACGHREADESNSTAGTVASRGKSAVVAQFLFCKCIKRKSVTPKMNVKVMQHGVRNGAVQWQISKSINDITHLCTGIHHIRDVSISIFLP